MKRWMVVAGMMGIPLLAVPSCTSGHAEQRGGLEVAIPDSANPYCATPGVSRLCPVVPHEVDVSLGFGYTGFDAKLQRHFDTFSWQSFVALNWPAAPNGTPLPTFSGNPRAPRVWETYLDAANVFRPIGQRIPCTPWPGERLLGQMAKNGNVVDPDGDYDEAVGGPLIDRNLNFALFEKKMNPQEVAFVRRNGLETVRAQQAMDTAVNFPAGFYQDPKLARGGQVGAMEVKAAWRIL